eukprot:COSAG01_NODE_11592_length_1897_cov_18.711902_5_plen_32_part_01
MAPSPKGAERFDVRPNDEVGRPPPPPPRCGGR